MIKSILLVIAQFSIICLLLMMNDSIFNHPLSWIISISGLLFGFYTLYFNRWGNFNVRPEIKKDAKLITHGAYKYIRHPMYFCVSIVMLGVILTSITLINNQLYGLLMVVLYLKAKREEALWSLQGSDYDAYKKNTKMFIPFVL